MAEEVKEINRNAVCRQLGFSRQAFYKTLHCKKQKSNPREIVRQEVLALRAQMPRLGTRKLYYLLEKTFKQQGLCVGRDKLFEILRLEGLLVAKKKRYVKTTQSYHWMRKHPNIIQDFQVEKPEQLWVADITYLRTTDDNYYLHLITDAYSKRIMGYCFSDNLSATSTLSALEMAIRLRLFNHPLIHHSDRGLQYCSALYVNTLEKNNIKISMTETGSPYDNAIAERVNGILKDEFGLDQVFKDRDQLEIQTIYAITTYNSLRPHQSNHLLTPQQMHKQQDLIPKAWHKKFTRTFKGSCEFLPSHNNIQKPSTNFRT